MAEIEQSSSKRKGLAKFKKRSTRVDLTPMVDLGFLLLTFFVFTSKLSQSHVMEMNQRIDGPPEKVGVSDAMHIILGAKNNLYYTGKLLDEATDLQEVNFSQIRSLLSEHKHRDSSNLMVFIKLSKHASFKSYVDILDEMLIADINPGHYAEVEISEEEERRVGEER